MIINILPYFYKRTIDIHNRRENVHCWSGFLGCWMCSGELSGCLRSRDPRTRLDRRTISNYLLMRGCPFSLPENFKLLNQHAFVFKLCFPSNSIIIFYDLYFLCLILWFPRFVLLYYHCYLDLSIFCHVTATSLF